MKKDFLKNFAEFRGKHLCWSLLFNTIAGFRPETPTQVFSCEFCKIFKNAFFTEHIWATASAETYSGPCQTSIMNFF